VGVDSDQPARSTLGEVMDCALAALETQRSPSRMRFSSILFETLARAAGDTQSPEFFRDLNLDQIVDAITAGREEYNLKPFFYTPLTDLAAIAYRHEIMRDLENDVLFRAVKSFSTQMVAVRAHLAAADKRSYKYEKERWFLDAVEIYCDAVETLLRELEQSKPGSRGLRAFRSYLAEHTASSDFQKLLRGAKDLKASLSAIHYSLLIKGSSITVRNFEAQADYSAVIEETFSRFKQGAVKDYRVKFNAPWGLNHIEAAVLDRVAQLNPKLFHELDEFQTRNPGFQERTIVAFDREIQFYIAYLEYAEAFKRAGLNFCYPKVSETCKAVAVREGFDLALAGKLIREKAAVVCNDFALDGPERIFVVTGPNQGGKTTFARTFGQLHYLASLGCPVPGTEAQLLLCDRIFTHFERAEDATSLHGKLESDLLRIHEILANASSSSIVIINEIFSSTTLQDAVLLSTKVLDKISQLDALCVCVTFLEELASLNEKTVSLVAVVAPENPSVRTFKIERKRADGLAHAMAIAEKYELTYARLKERIKL
jgi:DNA mismatch repair protein MutS